MLGVALAYGLDGDARPNDTVIIIIIRPMGTKVYSRVGFRPPLVVYDGA